MNHDQALQSMGQLTAEMDVCLRRKKKAWNHMFIVTVLYVVAAWAMIVENKPLAYALLFPTMVLQFLTTRTMNKLEARFYKARIRYEGISAFTAGYQEGWKDRGEEKS
jgi:hypothetical protein